MVAEEEKIHEEVEAEKYHPDHRQYEMKFNYKSLKVYY